MNTTHAWVASFGATLLLLLAASHASGAQGTPKPNPINPNPVRTPIDPSARIGTVRLPAPLERSNAIAKLGLTPTQLQSGRAVTYSVRNVEDRDGQLNASCVSFFKKSGYWILYSDGDRECPTGLSITFRTQRGQQYVVDFAFDPTAAPQFATYGAASGAAPLTVTPVDGHSAHVVTGTGGSVTVRLESLSTASFTFFHVKVTPLTS